MTKNKILCIMYLLKEESVLAKEKRNYSKRDASEFNKFRTFWQILVCGWIYMFWYKLVYRLEVYGKENIPKNNKINN